MEVNMPRTRAYRRHKRRVKLERRYRILAENERCSWQFWFRPTNYRGPDPRDMNAHLRCSCWELPDARSLQRRREEREWRRIELDAY